MEKEKKVRRHYWFSGMVQGVGFRYRAFHIAQSLDLTGWVRNAWDERVEMEVEGSREAISKMLLMLSEQSFISIEGIEEKTIPLEDDGWFCIR